MLRWTRWLMRWPSCRSTSLRGGSAAIRVALPMRAWAALSRHGAGDGAGSPQVGVSRAAAFLDHAGRAAVVFLRRARNVTMPKPAANSGSAAGMGTGFTIAESIRKLTLAVKPAPD